MILLDKENYGLVLEPLSKVTFNKLFARSVVEKKIEGKVYVDKPVKPETFCVVHPYGMALLFGDYNNDRFNSAFAEYALNTKKIRTGSEWLQVYPDAWNEKLSSLLKDKIIKSGEAESEKSTGLIEKNTRVNFKFNKGKYLAFKSNFRNEGYNIQRTNEELFELMSGSVVPKIFLE